MRSRSRSIPPSIGRYDVIRPIGAGSMGQVLLARDRILEREVAVKLLRDDLSIDDEVRQALVTRMRHEARAAARVNHPNLVTLHDMGEDDVVGLYLVFEFLDGPTLKRRLQEGRLPVRQVARIARELGSALTYAHERGVLHRDVKPENVLLTETGSKLADFGIARVPDSTLTRQEGLLGTPAYSAPETFKDNRFSPASDQFSLAATLYEALSGERAFPGDDALTVANRIANETPEPIAPALGYPPSLDAVFTRALAKEPADRFASCRDFGIALVEALDARMARRKGPRDEEHVDPSDVLAAASFRSGERHELGPRERRGTHLALGALAALLLVGVTLRAWFGGAEPPRTATGSASLASAVVSASASSAPVRGPVRRSPPRSAPSAAASVSSSGATTGTETPAIPRDGIAPTDAVGTAESVNAPLPSSSATSPAVTDGAMR